MRGDKGLSWSGEDRVDLGNVYEVEGGRMNCCLVMEGEGSSRMTPKLSLGDWGSGGTTGQQRKVKEKEAVWQREHNRLSFG